MVDAITLNCLPRRIPIATPPEGNHLRSGQYDVFLSMRSGLARGFPLRRSFAYPSITALHCPRSREQPPKTPSTMATKSGNPEEISAEEEEEEKKKASLPPPPEKPEPGDCCGSGCVRCVWDVYYEEVEEYNKLCRSIYGESKSD